MAARTNAKTRRRAVRPRRAERLLCEHLLPVLAWMREQGYRVYRTTVGPTFKHRDFVSGGDNREVAPVDVRLVSGPDFRDLRRACRWPKVVVYGSNWEERVGPVERWLSCRHCIRTIWWPWWPADGRK